MKKEKWIIAAVVGVGVAAITYNLLSKDIPDGAMPVEPFDKERYMGLWNEIARLPNLIEKNISQLTEEYSMDNGGDMKVITKGYNSRKNKWVEVAGKMKMAGADDIGMLKVSYFGPFYLSYNVLDIDADYKYALVSGSSLDYLWILSKDSSIPDDVKNRFLEIATAVGFDVDKLEWV